MRKLGILAMALGLAIMSIPAAGADSASRPFKGSAVGEVTFPLDPDCPNYGGLRTDSTAVGTASHLGRIVMEGQHCTPAPGEGIAGEQTFVAANGDEVYMTYSGVPGPPNPDGVIVFDVNFDIIGGSGRFEGAEGGGTMIAYVVFEGLLDPAWSASWVWEGTIGY